MGQSLKLVFSKTSQQRFLERRIAHHHAQDQSFLGLFRVTGTIDHTVRPGDNLWVLSHKVYSVPPWLITVSHSRRESRHQIGHLRYDQFQHQAKFRGPDDRIAYHLARTARDRRRRWRHKDGRDPGELDVESFGFPFRQIEAATAQTRRCLTSRT